MKQPSFITEHNKFWWQQLCQHFDVSVKYKETHRVKATLKEKQLNVVIPKNECSKEVFTFEIIKLYFLSKEIYISDYLQVRAKREPLLGWVFTENLFAWVGGQIENIKSLMLLKEAGYSIAKIYAEVFNPVSPLLLQHFHTDIKKKNPSAHSANLYLNQFFSLSVGFLFTDTLEDRLYELKELRPELFSILNEYLENWKSFSFQPNKISKTSYKLFTNHFIQQLGKWNVHHVLSKNKQLV